MRRAFSAVFVALVLAGVGCSSDSNGKLPGIERAVARGPQDFLRQAVVGPQGDGTYVVATTQIVSPAGQSVVFRGRPTDLALHPDGNLLAVKSSFDVVLVESDSGTIRQSLPLPSIPRASFPTSEREARATAVSSGRPTERLFGRRMPTTRFMPRPWERTGGSRGPGASDSPVLPSRTTNRGSTGRLPAGSLSMRRKGSSTSR